MKVLLLFLSLILSGQTHIDDKIKKSSELYLKMGIPERISYQMGYNLIRKDYKGKNSIILDTKLKLLYVFDKNGKFIAKTPIISGMDTQSNEPEKIKVSLMSWDEMTKYIGFKWNDYAGYIDVNGKNREYSDDLVYNEISRTKTRFLPKGIYTTSTKMTDESSYFGKTKNQLMLFHEEKELSHAIHSYYPSQIRKNVFKKLETFITKPTNPKISNEYYTIIKNINMNLSYGCFNVPPEFLPILRKFCIDSFVFNLGEEDNDYLL